MLFSWSGFSQAVVVSDLYQVSVPVEDQTRESQKQGIEAALQQVLIKVSGFSSVLDNAEIRQQMGSRSARFVKSFRYDRDEIDDSVRLTVVFASNLIDELLRNHGEPIWGKSRPLILNWLAIESDSGRSIVNQSMDVWPKMTEQAFSERGLPLLWPALDLEDDIALPVEKLSAGFKSDIQQASGRYQTDGVLAGRLARVSSEDNDKAWSYRGAFFHQQQWLPIEISSSSPESSMVAVTDQVASYLAGRYAVNTSGDRAQGNHQLIISGVESFQQYHDVLQYLKSKVAITDVQVIQVQKQTLTLSLTLATDWGQVWQLLELDKRLLQDLEAQQLVWQ